MRLRLLGKLARAWVPGDEICFFGCEQGGEAIAIERGGHGVLPG
jgi:hypothetical protein